MGMSGSLGPGPVRRWGCGEWVRGGKVSVCLLLTATRAEEPQRQPRRMTGTQFLGRFCDSSLKAYCVLSAGRCWELQDVPVIGAKAAAIGAAILAIGSLSTGCLPFHTRS